MRGARREKIDKYFDSFRVRDIHTGTTHTVESRVNVTGIFNGKFVEFNYLIVDGLKYSEEEFENRFNDNDDYEFLDLLEEIRIPKKEKSKMDELLDLMED